MNRWTPKPTQLRAVAHLLCASITTLALLTGVQAKAQVSSCPDFSPPRDGWGKLAKAYTWTTYEAPASGEIGEKPHGTLTRCYHLSQSVTREASGMSYAGAALIMRHVTEDAVSNKRLASAVLFLSAESQGQDLPVVVFNTATIGNAAHCGATVQTLSRESTFLVRDKIDRFLRDGYNVLVPDYLGHGVRGQEGHPYLEGRSEAHAVLDAIRAARQLPSPHARMYRSTAPSVPVKLGMQGYSQGGHVTAWTTQLAPTYAPELRFDAIRAGGVPVDLAVSIGNALEAFESGGNDSGFAPLAIVALMQSTDPATRMTWDDVLPYVHDVDDVEDWVGVARNECRGVQQVRDLYEGMRRTSFDAYGFLEHVKVKRWLVRNSLSGGVASLLFAGDANLQAELAAETMLSRPNAPFMFYGSPGDTVAPAAEVRALMGAWPGSPLPESTFVMGYVHVPAAAQVWVHTSGAHGLDEADLYWTTFSSIRYTPDEWLATYLQ